MQGDENTDRKYNHSVQKKGSYNNNNITFNNQMRDINKMTASERITYSEHKRHPFNVI